MAKIAAFIGHSFADANKDVVREFLEFFKHVKDTLDDFTWEHAEPAEPKALSEKVKNLTTDKNLFIGICFIWNHKRVYRIYRELELNLRIRQGNV